MMYSLCKISSIEKYILELVKLSIERKSSAIAIRFSPRTRKIQIVDNGIGFSKYELSQICKNKDVNPRQRTVFDEIIRVSKAIILTSRIEFSSHTFVKAISANNRRKLFEGYHRPSKGTTITIYNFNSPEWSNSDNINCSIPYVIASVAFTKLKISFSIRNDDLNKTLLDVKNPHSPWDILHFFQNNYIDNISSQSNSQDISKKESSNFDKVYTHGVSNNKVNIYNNNKNTVNSLSQWSNWSYKPESRNDNICSPLSEWSNWLYKNETSNIKLSSSANQLNNLDNSLINLTQMSIWSDWSYQPQSSTENSKESQYIFLPISIYRRLPYKYINLLHYTESIKCSQSILLNITNPDLKTTIQEISRNLQDSKNIRVLNLKHKFDECRLFKNTICSLEILRQVNNEFIAAITNDNGKKLLIMVDQHAVHERIRYEWLIETYRDKESYKYFSMKLDIDLLISGINKKLLNIIIANRKVLSRVGIHIKSIINSTTCTVDAVPKCFIRNIKSYKKECNLHRLTKNVKQLIIEVADGLSVSQSVLPPVLPISINNVIASEACHEAIKFGDPLNVKECTLLMQALQDTKAPTRCAHGRPSMIPLINLPGVEKRRFALKKKKKLNFALLRNRISMNK